MNAATETVLILGATSAMAEHAARVHAQRGDRLILVARRADALETVADDLRVRGQVEVETFVADLSQPGSLEGGAKAWLASLGRLDRAYVFYGELGDQAAAERDIEAARRLIQINYTSAAEWVLALANVFEGQGAGRLVVITSVAADRGRMSNYVYGSAKAGISTLVQGLDHRLSKVGARAVSLKFGFVISPMTAGMNRSGPLWIGAAEAGRLAVRSGDKQRGVVYAPWFWRFIMLIIRLVPTPIFNRTKL